MVNLNWSDFISVDAEGNTTHLEVELSVDNIHMEYADMSQVWERCRDAYAGGFEIKRKGEGYLPKLNTSQKKSDYEDYLNRAYWYGGVNKTVIAFVSMINRKPPSFKLDGSQTDDFKDFLKHVTSGGKSAEDFVREILQEVFIVNRVGVLEDFPSMLNEDGEVLQMTVLQAEENQIASMSSVYKAEDIINWFVEEIDGKEMPTLFVLREERTEFDSEDSFQAKTYYAYRLLFLEEEFLEDSEGNQTPTGNIRYGQAVFAPGESKNTWVLESLVYPQKDGDFLTEIPFWIITGEGIDYGSPKIPIIYDLVEVNLGHYRNTADYERELHRVSTKTAIFPGWNKDIMKGEPEIGGSIASPPGETPFILESKTPSPLKEELTNKEKRMATLGAQLLAQQGRYVQAADTAKIQARGETSVVASVARSVALSVGTVFSFKVDWSDVGIEVSVELNTDFDETPFNAQDLKTLMELLQGGTLSFQAFYHALEALEVYPENWSMDQEIESIHETTELLQGQNSSEEFNALQSQILEIQNSINSGQSGKKIEEQQVDQGQGDQGDNNQGNA